MPQAGLQIKALLQLQAAPAEENNNSFLPCKTLPDLSAKEICMRFTKSYHIFLHPHSLENPSKSAGFTVVIK